MTIMHVTASLQRRAASLLMLLGACAAATPALAQAPWPEARPIAMIVPFPPGGVADTVARPVAEALGKALGQSFIVENIGGGGGVIACQTTVKAPADGYTLLQGYVATHGTSPATRSKLPYDAIKDFTPVATIGRGELLLVVHPSVSANTLQELIALAKAKPGVLTYASSGNGTLDTIAWHVYTGGGWHLLCSEDVPRLGFGTLPAFMEGPVDIALPTWIFTVGNWYRMRFSHSLNGDTQAHRDGVCRLYYYGEQRSNTASLWTAQTRWDAGDVVHGDTDGPPQLDTMSANLEWLDTRRNTTNPVMRQSRQLRDESPETRTETVFTRRIHRWLAYENATR